MIDKTQSSASNTRCPPANSQNSSVHKQTTLSVDAIAFQPLSVSSDAPDPTKVIGRLCRYGAKCQKAGCTFLHTHINEYNRLKRALFNRTSTSNTSTPANPDRGSNHAGNALSTHTRDQAESSTVSKGSSLSTFSSPRAYGDIDGSSPAKAVALGTPSTTPLPTLSGPLFINHFPSIPSSLPATTSPLTCSNSMPSALALSAEDAPLTVALAGAAVSGPALRNTGMGMGVGLSGDAGVSKKGSSGENDEKTDHRDDGMHATGITTSTAAGLGRSLLLPPASMLPPALSPATTLFHTPLLAPDAAPALATAATPLPNMSASLPSLSAAMPNVSTSLPNVSTSLPTMSSSLPGAVLSTMPPALHAADVTQWGWAASPRPAPNAQAGASSALLPTLPSTTPLSASSLAASSFSTLSARAGLRDGADTVKDASASFCTDPASTSTSADSSLSSLASLMASLWLPHAQRAETLDTPQQTSASASTLPLNLFDTTSTSSSSSPSAAAPDEAHPAAARAAELPLSAWSFDAHTRATSPLSNPTHTHAYAHLHGHGDSDLFPASALLLPPPSPPSTAYAASSAHSHPHPHPAIPSATSTSSLSASLRAADTQSTTPPSPLRLVSKTHSHGHNHGPAARGKDDGLDAEFPTLDVANQRRKSLKHAATAQTPTEHASAHSSTLTSPRRNSAPAPAPAATHAHVQAPVALVHPHTQAHAQLPPQMQTQAQVQWSPVAQHNQQQHQQHQHVSFAPSLSSVHTQPHPHPHSHAQSPVQHQQQQQQHQYQYQHQYSQQQQQQYSPPGFHAYHAHAPAQTQAYTHGGKGGAQHPLAQATHWPVPDYVRYGMPHTDQAMCAPPAFHGQMQPYGPPRPQTQPHQQTVHQHQQPRWGAVDEGRAHSNKAQRGKPRRR